MTQLDADIMAVANGALGAVLAGYGAVLLYRTSRTKSWPSVPGRVSGTRVTSASRRGGTVYFGHVSYEYTIGGRTYQSARRVLGGAVPGSVQDAHRLCSRYNVGDTVWVFYDPADPAQAVLEHASPGVWRWLLIGSLFLAFAIWYTTQAGT